MVKTAILTSEYAEVQKAFERKGKQYYYLNLLPKEDGDMTICLQSLLDHEPTEEDKESILSQYADICKTTLKKEYLSLRQLGKCQLIYNKWCTSVAR